MKNRITINAETADPKKYIIIKGARVHNLKNISVAIPRNKLIVITGLSGSGKSSLAFDTLYAEGQRRYVESLSSYARQFLGKIDKPDVDYIKGISPAIAIEQKVNTRNPRSTVGTSTEIYDYLKLLFARIGKTYSPKSGKEVKRHSVDDVVNFISTLKNSTKVMLLAPLHVKNGRTFKEQLEIISSQGFSRITIKGEIHRVEDVIEKGITNKAEVHILIDRFVTDNNPDNYSRIADSVQTAFYEGDGECMIEVVEDEKKVKKYSFSNRFEADGIIFEDPSVHFFSFNNPVGACKTCEGFGSVIGIDENLVIPDKSLSIYNEAIVCWKGEKMSWYKDQLILHSSEFNFPIHRPYSDLTKEEKQLLWAGNKYFEGLNSFFKMLEQNAYKVQYRVMLSRYRGKTTCPDCRGTRLRKDANYVKFYEKSISEIVLMPVSESLNFFQEIQLEKFDKKVADRLLKEITSRLLFLNNVGLGYLTLNRLSSTLSGGESQRINLATSLGSSLVGSLYVLDEPSIGLHPKDTQRLIKVLHSLRNLGNTVVVVEHDEEIMHAADYIIDMGLMAGTQGGEVVFTGTHDELQHEEISLTARYLTYKEQIPVPEKRKSWKHYIEVNGARENNLKNVNVKFPLGVMTVVTGVSGSGKSSLVKGVLYPALKKQLGGYGEVGDFDKLSGNTEMIKLVEFVDQNPIGRSSRSNPVTYIKAFDEIRALFADCKQSKLNGFKPSHFSTNVDGGRCDVCQGEGTIKVEMQFMADIELKCEICNGKRYKEEVLEVYYNKKNIYDILCMTVDDAIEFFESYDGNTENRITHKLKSLQDVGLGYVQLGQSSSTLSGGEAQRVKLASFILSPQHNANTMFIFDEPTTGLHFHDIKKLLASFNSLIKQGHTIVIIEHNTEVIKCADWIIDIGPEGGEKGGNIVFEGIPEDIINCKSSYTGNYLSRKI